MTRLRSRKPVKDAATIQQPAPPTQNDFSDAEDHFGSDDPVEKDETEVELEKLVFGDDAGFLEGLKSHRQEVARSEVDQLEEVAEGKDTSADEDEGLEGIADADLFFLDSGPPGGAGSQDTVASRRSDHGDNTSSGNFPPAWVDSDDERLMISLASNPRLRKLRISEAEDVVNGKEYTTRLRRQFERLNPIPDWANLSATKRPRKRRRISGGSDSSEENSSADEMAIDDDDLSVQPLAKLLQNADSLTQTTSNTLSGRKRLRPEVIDIQRTKDVGGIQPSAITSLSFHPTYPLLLSSGPASTLHLHHISPMPPNPNPLLTSLHLRSTPLNTTAFHPPTGSRIFFSGRRRYFHIWDLRSGKVEKVTRIYGHQDEQRSMESFKLSPCGRWMGLVGTGRKGGGVLNVLDAGTCQWVAQTRVDSRGGVADFAWWGDGNGMTIIGKNGEALEWDGREKRVVGRWVDEGAVGTTVLALGGRSGRDGWLGGNRWVAVGSSSGIVNIYDRRGWGGKDGLATNPKPTRTFDQLTTATSHLVFAPDGQILAMGSRWKRDALRLIHLPSCTVYRNWPTSSTPLGRITAAAFSPTSEMLAVANEQGKIRLWEIRS
ncbi:MAG: hypothetical protein FRX48_02729 [Lasallia pustulata]|uniref:Uncharacterized protein n=1 Tax=Lasallia pustulata TaxID=136370 RepID=A0A5M8PU92_9LECA|nr:MAG: hypothetical protein FRX48_02729 [Lasallia pustulata]